MNDDYTFVTLDYNMVTTGDAIFVDIDDISHSEMDFVWIDEADFQYGGAAEDFIDFIMLDDMDVNNDMEIDSYMSDINEYDVTIIL